MRWTWLLAFLLLTGCPGGLLPWEQSRTGTPDETWTQREIEQWERARDAIPLADG